MPRSGRANQWTRQIHTPRAWHRERTHDLTWLCWTRRMAFAAEDWYL